MPVQRSKWKLITGPVSVSRPVLWERESKEALIMIITWKQELSGSTSARVPVVVVVAAAVDVAEVESVAVALVAAVPFASAPLSIRSSPLAPTDQRHIERHTNYVWVCICATRSLQVFHLNESVHNYLTGNWLHTEWIAWTVQMFTSNMATTNETCALTAINAQANPHTPRVKVTVLQLAVRASGPTYFMTCGWKYSLHRQQLYSLRNTTAGTSGDGDGDIKCPPPSPLLFLPVAQ